MELGLSGNKKVVNILLLVAAVIIWLLAGKSFFSSDIDAGYNNFENNKYKLDKKTDLLINEHIDFIYEKTVRNPFIKDIPRIQKSKNGLSQNQKFETAGKLLSGAILKGVIVNENNSIAIINFKNKINYLKTGVILNQCKLVDIYSKSVKFEFKDSVLIIRMKE